MEEPRLTSDEIPWRLIDGRDDDAVATRWRVSSRIMAARWIDRTLARSGLSHPVVFVSGFWRSGTTWVQECLVEALAAKAVFEPLSPLDPARGAALATLFPGDEDAAQAYIPTPTDGLDPVWAAFDRAMISDGCSAFALSCRWSVSESFRRAIVVKDVRSQGILDLIHARYGVPVVHVRRHPCAVVSSLLRARWHWSFARVRLGTVLPAMTWTGVERDHFDADEISRIAASWAWSERCAAASLAGRSWGHLIAYEDMVRDPASVLQELCTNLGLTRTAPVAFEQASATIRPADLQARGGATEQWRQQLSTLDIDRIERIATTLYPDWRAGWATAPH